MITRRVFCASVLAPVLIPAAPDEIRVLFGTHTAAPGKGFSVSRFNTVTGALSAPEFLLEAPAPAYFILTPDNHRLYTCNSPGFVSAYSVDRPGVKLKLLNQQPSGGGDPSYISLDKTGQYVFGANYDGGSIAAWKLNADGGIGDRTAFVQHTGSGTNPQRQKHAYAHSIVPAPGNRFVLVGDLGLDKLFVYKFDVKDGSLKPNDPPFAAVAPGSGARHVTFHPNARWVYLITEMASTIIHFDWDARRGGLKELGTVSTLPAGFSGVSACAEIRVHPNGRFVYASNRGRDSLAAFSIDSKTGRLTAIQDIPSGGRTPRNFDFDPSGQWLLATNHGSNTAAVFRIDARAGTLTQTGEPIAVPSPFCPRFLV